MRLGCGARFDSLDGDANGAISREELREGFLKYAMLRQAMTAVVTTLVAESQPWSVGEWAVALRFDIPRATVLVLVLGREFWVSKHRKRL